ncbi:DUF58 domain-containing protein [Paenibacillus roseus]|uniref:DUF58 domain-containing protein n=1 Tax=Paenibacillus roseus TaxID=2798579 RepID=A0A934J4D1_9BACL|nr:DUF58 domain-containing protein [Paenibacillus roseus]MBJ6363059.1 DUF58 domain-containing protein [Paenibacillus roseus]
MNSSHTHTPNVRWWVVASIYLSALVFLLFQGGKASLMVFLILNVLLLYLGLGRWSGIKRVQGERRVMHNNSASPSLTAGSRLEVQLRVKIPGYWPIPYVLLRERLVRQGGKDLPFEVSFVPDFKRSGTVNYLTPPLQRGNYHFSQTLCSTKDIFGLIEHTGEFSSEDSFRVLPKTVAIRSWSQLRLGMRGPYSHTAAARSSKETTQINGVRDYLYGDRLSRIHWNATARTGKWKSKEFEREAMPRSIVVLDRSSVVYNRPELFELAVSTAASLFDFGLRNENAMGFVSVGLQPELWEPRSTFDHRSDIMNHLVGVASNARLPLFQALQQADSSMPQGSLAIIVSPQGGEPVIRAMQLLDRKGLVPCLVYMDSTVDSAAADEQWQQFILRKGWSFYKVKSLQELPAVLEGGGQRAYTV